MSRRRIKRAVALLMMVCIVIQTAMSHVTDVLANGDSSGKLFKINDARIYKADGTIIASGSNADMAEPVTIRYEFEIDDGAKPGDEVTFQIPEQLEIYDKINFKLVDADTNLKFAQVTVGKDGTGSIVLLKDSEKLGTLEGWFQIKTFWNYKVVADEKNPTLAFLIGNHTPISITVKLDPIKVTADMGIKKNGTVQGDGSIQWQITVNSSTNPAGYPLKHVKITDMIPLDQDYVDGSWSVSQIQGAAGAEETSELMAAYGFYHPSENSYRTASPSSYSFRSASLDEKLTVDEAEAGFIWDEKADFILEIQEKEKKAEAATPSNASASNASWSYRSRSTEPELLTMPGFRSISMLDQSKGASGLTILPANKEEETQEELDHGTLVYEFPNAVQGTYLITYRTKMNEAGMKAVGTAENNGEPGYPDGDLSQYRFKNTASVTWPKDAVSDPSDPGTDPKLIGTAEASATLLYPIKYLNKAGEVMPGADGIKWTVQVNPNGLTIAEDAWLTDVIQQPKYVRLAQDSQGYKVFYEEAGGSGPVRLERCPECDRYHHDTGRCSDPAHFTYSEETHELQYVVGGKPKGTFSYYTTIDGDTYKNDGYKAITNQVALGYGGGFYGRYSAVPVYPMADWISKTGRYNPSNHQITWAVTINAKNQDLKDAVFTDKLELEGSNAQKYVPGTFWVDRTQVPDDDGSLSIADSSDGKSQTLTYDLGEINRTYTISFNTELLNEKDYQTNQLGRSYLNTGRLEADYEESRLSQSSTGTVGAPSDVIKKAGVGTYNHVEHSLEWQITINGNRMPIENAVVTDEIEDDLELAFASKDGTEAADIIVKKVSGDGTVTTITEGNDTYDTSSSSKNKLVVSFSGTITDEYRITLKTKLKEETIQTWFQDTNGVLTIENQASLAGTNLPSVSSNLCEQQLENSIIKKEAVYEDGDDFITWRILINQHRTAIPLVSEPVGNLVESVYIEDALVKDLKLDLGSVKLYKNVDVSEDGSYSLEKAEAVYSTDAKEKENKLTYGKDGEDPAYGHNVYYHVADPEDQQHSGYFRFSFTGRKADGSAIASISGDAAGGQTIFDKENYVLEFVTDVLSPNASINNSVTLWGTGQKDDLDEAQGVRYSIGEGGGLGRRATVEIEKVDKYDNSMKITDAEFSLYDKSERAKELGIDDQPVISISDKGGKTTYSMLYFNNTYQLQESKAPDGYKQVPGDETWYVDINDGSVGPSAGGTPPTFTLEKSQMSATGVKKVTVENTPKFGWFSFKKAGSTDNIPLAGVEFTVYKEDKKTVALKYTDLNESDGGATEAKVATEDDGQAVIEGLRCGTYYLKETKAPDGYAANDTYYKFTIPYDVGEGYTPGSYSSGKLSSFESDSGNAAARGSFDSDNADGVSGKNPVIHNDPVGEIVVYKQNPDGNAADGATIGLYSKDNKLIASKVSKDGNVTFGNDGKTYLKAGTYQIREIFAPTGYRLNSKAFAAELHIKQENGKEQVVLTEATENPTIINVPIGSITIKKTEAGTSTPLAEAEFTLYTDSSCETKAGAELGVTQNPVTTGKNGEAKFKDINLGTYYIKETARPSGYKINTQVFKANLTRPGQSETLPCSDEPIKAKIQILKTDSLTGDGLGGAIIRLTNKDNPKQTWTETTNDDGYATFADLRVGTYIAAEEKAPKGYRKGSVEIELEIQDKEEVSGTAITVDTNGKEAVIANEPIGSFLFEKTDKVTKKPLDGATIQIKDADGTIVGTGVTGKGENADGTCLFEDLSYGTYTWEETDAPKGYLLPNPHPTGTIMINTNTVTVKMDQPLANRPLPAFRLQIKKTGEPDHRLLDGAVFEVRRKDAPDQVIATGTTVDGIADLGQMHKGVAYYYQEVTAPKGYRLDPNKYEFEYPDDGSDAVEIQSISVQDQLSRGSFTITKADSSSQASPIENVEFQLKYLDAGTQGVEDVVDKGKTWSQKTDELGRTIFGELPLGRYEITEVSAPPQYHVDRSWSYQFELTADGENAEYQTQNSSGETNNYLVNFGVYKGKLILTKTDTGTALPDEDTVYQPLQGARIGVYLQSDGQLVLEAVTDAQGKAVFDGLWEGDYYYQEIEPPEGYGLDTDRYVFTIGREGGVPEGEPMDGVVLERTLTNRLIIGQLDVTKTDSEDGKPLSGASIGLFTEAGNKLDEKTTDADGRISFEGLKKGKYYVQEITAPAGYVLDETHRPFEIGQLDETIQLQIQNERIYSGLARVTKVDGEDGKSLSGAVFGLFTNAGNKLSEKVTDGDGKVSFEGLKKGNYYIQEITAPAGYLLDASHHSFEVSQVDDIFEFRLKNNKIYKGLADVTKVDGESGKRLTGAVIGLYTDAGEKLDEKVTDEDGKAGFEDLKKGRYYIQELSAPDGYALDAAHHPFEITRADDIIKIRLENERIYNGQAEVTKVAAGTGTTLSGAVIGLFTEAGVQMEERTTYEDGKAVFGQLKKGTYYIQEIKAPSGYVLDGTRHPFEILQPEDRIEVKLENKRITSSSSDSGGGGGSKPGSSGQTLKPGEIGPGITPTEPDHAGTGLPEEESRPAESVPEPPKITGNSDGSVTIVPPGIPEGTEVSIVKPNGTVVYRGVTAGDGSISIQLEPGDYSLIYIGDEGVPLANLPFTIDDLPVPLAAPPAGDHSAPMAVLILVLLAALAGIGILLRNRRRYMDGLRGSGDANEKKNNG